MINKKLRQWCRYLSLFLLCLALTVGCNSNQTPTTTTTTDSNRISIGTTLKPRTLDPADNYELAGLNIIYNVGETLYTYELGTTEIVPLLATQMPQVSEDRITYTIPLREGVTFQDDTPFNAEAMVFSLNRFITNGGKPAFLLADVVDTIEATAEYEITVKLKQPFSAFPALLAFPGTCAVSPKSYEIGAGKFNPNTLVGTGKYKLTEFSSDSISLDVNETYWGEQPANEGINIQVYAGNSANLFNSFRTGAIDVAYQSLDPNQINNLLTEASADKWQVIDGSGTVVNYLVLNLNQQPLDQLEVRQAIAALIDRNLINQRVLQGQGELVYSLIPTAFASYKPAFAEIYGEANISKAKELITKAGYSRENPAIVEIWYPSGSITRGIVGETLKALVEKELDGAIQFVPQSVESASFFSNLSQGIYPAALADWYPDFLDADNYIQPFLSCSQGSQSQGCQEGAAQSRGSFYYSDRVNQLINQQRQEVDPETRQTIFAQLQQTLAQDVPYIPLWQTKDYAFAHNDIQGLTINPSQNIPFWTLKRNS
ncbi:MAG: ABC transporter substrate-binding protein [Xenococcaceae cyanobacterium MO_167.B27]|nr:ABC transporter substrate-binding protein [Xenococcaceae cyanobacterium MO_167.B27]